MRWGSRFSFRSARQLLMLSHVVIPSGPPAPSSPPCSPPRLPGAKQPRNTLGHPALGHSEQLHDARDSAKGIVCGCWCEWRFVCCLGEEHLRPAHRLFRRYRHSMDRTGSDQRRWNGIRRQDRRSDQYQRADSRCRRKRVCGWNFRRHGATGHARGMGADILGQPDGICLRDQSD